MHAQIPLLCLALLLTPAPEISGGDKASLHLKFSELDKNDLFSFTPQEIVAECTRLLAASEKESAKQKAEWHFQRGKARSRLNDVKESMEDFAAACQLAPQDATARAHLAVAHLALKDPKSALRESEEALRLGPKIAQCHLARAAVAFSAGDVKKALGSAGEAIRLDDRYDEAYWLRALIHFHQNDANQSLKDLDRYLAICPVDPTKDRAFPYYLHGSCLLLLNRPQDAQRSFMAGASLDPRSNEVTWGTYMAYRDLRKWHMAAHMAEVHATIRPDHPLSFLIQADAQAELGNFERANALVEKAHEIRNDAQSLCAAGEVNCKLGNYNAALEAYDSAIKVTTNGGAIALAGKAMILASCPERKFRNGEESLRLALKAHEQAPEFYKWRTTLALAEAHAELGKFDVAEKLAREALPAVKAAPLFKMQVERRIECFEKQTPFRMQPCAKKGQ
jgi:tetratricopeptide (TPR) repeat protein